MRKIWGLVPILLASIFISACSMDDKPPADAGFQDPEHRKIANDLAEHVIHRDKDAILAAFGGFLDPEEEEFQRLSDQLPDILELLPPGELTATLIYSEQRHLVEDETVIGFGAQYDIEGTEGGFAALSATFFPDDGECCSLTWLNIEPTERRPSTFNDFTFEGKGFTHYLVALLLVTLPVFCAATAVFCAFNKRITRKYLWIPFILVGLWGFDFNWTTGQITFELFNVQNGMFNFQLFSIHLLSAAFAKYGYFAPWIITIGSPVGAIWYWIIGRKGPKSKQPEQF